MVEAGPSIRMSRDRVALVEEAGGRFTDFASRRVFDAGTTLASNGVLHETVGAMIQTGEEGPDR